MYHSKELDTKVKKMSDEELEANLKILSEAFIIKGTYWIGVEICRTFDEKSRRGLFEKMPSALLTSRFQHLSAVVESLSFRAGFASRQELAFIKKEMKKRRIL